MTGPALSTVMSGGYPYTTFTPISISYQYNNVPSLSLDYHKIYNPISIKTLCCNFARGCWVCAKKPFSEPSQTTIFSSTAVTTRSEFTLIIMFLLNKSHLWKPIRLGLNRIRTMSKSQIAMPYIARRRKLSPHASHHSS